MDSDTRIWSGVGESDIDPVPVEKALDRFATNTSEYISERIQYFDPFKAESEADQRAREKAFAEASIYQIFAENHDRSVSQNLHELTRQRANDSDYHEPLGGYPEAIPEYGHTLLCTEMRDELSTDARIAFEDALDALDLEKLEDHVTLLLEIQTIYELWGYEPNPVDVSNVLEESVAYSDIDVISATLYETYDLAHISFYYHNMGGSYHDSLDKVTGIEFSDLLHGLILKYIGVGDPDAVLELTIAGILNRCLSAEIVTIVLSWVDSLIRETGYLEAYLYGDEHFLPDKAVEEMEEWTVEQQEWGNNYHTNLIGAIAGVVLTSYIDSLDVASGSFPKDGMGDLLKIAELLDTVDRSPARAANQLIDVRNRKTTNKYKNILECVANHIVSSVK
ncbi:hypothetical protein NJ7G_3921 [Natrinema sp. J7-2]|nr:hypothetical protein NJ7G_3921 [Natrinema sp. J7-2]